MERVPPLKQVGFLGVGVREYHIQENKKGGRLDYFQIY
jgi:hypothetical protein